MNRFQLLKSIQEQIKDHFVICNIGYPSQELFKIQDRNNYFYMLGTMGLCSSIGLGLALSINKPVISIDGDGSILMHLGSLRTIGHLKNNNLKHVMFNNSSHESVGGQPTYADTIDFKDLVISLGYKKYFVIKNKNHLKTVLKKFIKSPGPSFLEVKIVNGSLNYLQRPKNLVKIKDHFIKN